MQIAVQESRKLCILNSDEGEDQVEEYAREVRDEKVYIGLRVKSINSGFSRLISFIQERLCDASLL